MTAPEGGFYSAQDADSEGEEGKFFVWAPDEVTSLLGAEDARLFNATFDVTPEGNFEGHSILHLERPWRKWRARWTSRSLTWRRARTGKRALFAAREQRVKPGRDEKVLTAWNGLMLRALAEAGAVLGRNDYLSAARATRRSCWAACRGQEKGGACCARTRTGRPGSTPTWRTMPSTPTVCWPSTRPPSTPLVRGAAGPGADQPWSSSRTRRGAGSSTPAPTTRPSSPAPRICTTTPPRPETRLRWTSSCRLAAYTGEGRTGSERSATSPPWRRPSRSIRRPSGACSPRWTSPSARCRRWPWWATRPAPIRAVSGGALLPLRSQPGAGAAPAWGGGDLAAVIPLLEGRTAIEGRATAYVCQHFACRLR